MKTKRLMVLAPVSFLLYATVQFFRPKEDLQLAKFEENNNLRFEDVKWKLVGRVINQRRKIYLHSLKDRLSKDIKSQTRKRIELYPYSDWKAKLSFVHHYLSPDPPVIATDTYWNQGNPTIVTALMDIGRGSWDLYKRPYHLYQNFMKPLLALDIHLYVFCDKDGADFVRANRLSYLNKTVIHILSLSDLPYYKYFPTIKRIMENEQSHWNKEWEPAMKKHPESFSSEYILLMNSKAHFLREASSRNPFGSKHFFWLDAGYGHGQAQYPPAGTVWSSQSLVHNTSLDGKVTFMKLRNVNLVGVELRHLYRKDIALVVGSFFGGTGSSVNNFYDIYDSVFLNMLKNNYVDDDQTLIVLCYQSHPELFNIIEGDWYDVFVLFS